ncbi:MAG: chromate resistance protein [Methylococcaceae bacterium]|nr:chromate resistance protein [Methylococcaceae bacterium]
MPTRNSAGRMRVWRALKALGCGVLRDGVYLLPNRSGLRHILQTQAEDVVAGGGSAHVLVLDSENQDQQKVFEGLFDRSADYAKLLETIQQTTDRELPSEEPAKLQRQIVRLRKTLESIVTLDFFPGAAREQAVAAVEDLEHTVSDRLMPNEPHAVHRRIKRLNSQDFQSRLWATRQRPWIDRLASAWLIARFIDPDARFIWLATPADCPVDALGFDFDGAAFTHVGAKVTFEVLLISFGLTKDVALQRLGGLVHYLDVGGIPVAEAAGLETMMRGMRERLNDDDTLLSEARNVFDSFYLVFSENGP